MLIIALLYEKFKHGGFMWEKVICTIAVLMWQIFISIVTHYTNDNKKYDIYNAIYQLIIFAIFQIVIWIIL